MTFSFDLPPETDTVVDVGAVVVKLGDTTVTDAAVLGSEWPVKQFSVSITYTAILCTYCKVANSRLSQLEAHPSMSLCHVVHILLSR